MRCGRSFDGARGEKYERRGRFSGQARGNMVILFDFSERMTDRAC